MPDGSFPIGTKARVWTPGALVDSGDGHLPSQDGRSLIAATKNMNTEQAILESPVWVDEMSDAIQDKIAGLYGKHFVRIDPVTKKPHANSKEFFWELVSHYPTQRGQGDKRPYTTLLMQKYHRAQTYKATAEPGNDRSGQVVKYIAFTSRNRNGDLVDTGSLPLSYSEFLKQFALDS